MKIVVIGSGYSGLAAVQELSKRFKNNKEAEIILFDKNEYTTIVPALPDIAGGKLSPADISENIDGIIPKNVKFIQEKVKSVDLNKNSITTIKNNYNYDYLIIASGSVINYCGFNQNLDKLYPVTSLEEAINLSQDFENYINKTEIPEVMIIGSGYTGIELAYSLDEKAKKLNKKVKITLVEKENKILPFLSEKQREYVKKYIEKRHYKLVTGTTIDKFDGKDAILANGEVYKNIFLCWCAGTTFAIPEIRGNYETIWDGRFVINDFLQLPAYPNVFAVGDSAAISCPYKHLRKAVNFSIYSGIAAAKNIYNLINSKKLAKFCPVDLGWVLPLGKTSVGLLFSKFSISGDIGMRLHYFMCGFRGYSFNRFIDFTITSIFLKKVEFLNKMAKFILNFLFKSGNEKNIFYLITRILFGANFIYHGFPKITSGYEGFASYLANLGIPFPEFMAYLAGYGEVIGGILLIIGLFTRISAINIAIIMLVGITIAHAGDPYKQQELAVVYLSLSLLYMTKGAGLYSLDRLMSKRLFPEK